MPLGSGVRGGRRVLGGRPAASASRASRSRIAAAARTREICARNACSIWDSSMNDPAGTTVAAQPPLFL